VFFFKTIKSNEATVTVISDAMFELHYGNTFMIFTIFLMYISNGNTQPVDRSIHPV